MHTERQAPRSLSIHVSCRCALVSTERGQVWVSFADVTTACPDHSRSHDQGKQSNRPHRTRFKVALVCLLRRHSLAVPVVKEKTRKKCLKQKTINPLTYSVARKLGKKATI